MPDTDTIALTLAHSPDADDMAMWWPLTGFLTPTGDRLRPPTIDTGRFTFHPMARDVEHLNATARERPLDITAISAAAWPALADLYAITDAGASFGENYGPKLVARADAPLHCDGCVRAQKPDIAIPGARTTAALVLKMVLGPAREQTRLVEMPFEQIAHAVAQGEVGAGLLIHEAQLTFEGHGLKQVLDLGQWWHAQTGQPLPLGLNVVRRGLEDEHGPGTLAEIDRLLSASVAHARANPGQTREYLLLHADTKPEWRDDALLERYLAMYVSDLTASMGPRGHAALERLYAQAQGAGLLPQAPTVDAIDPARV
ncbi:MAG: ABC transporter substrate-binding protein [Phycisphaeraceae bacterium]|nr:ABC transporter substrate-binding protein [Phycisphaeraceae bacterium]